MGMMYVTAELGPSRQRLAPVRFLVDTGSFYTIVPPGLAAELGLTLPGSTNIMMADGTRVPAPLGNAFIRIHDRESGTRESGTVVASMDVFTPLLGALSMQLLDIKVNMKHEAIEFAEG